MGITRLTAIWMTWTVTALTTVVAVSIPVRASDLEAGFRNPPDSARLWVYWTQSGNYCLKSATADLEAMKEAGIGGVLRMDCSVGQIPNAAPFLGEEWRKQFVHCVHECERLGLEFAAITGPGWTGTGGPWIQAKQSMQHLVPATVHTKGPGRFNQVLPLPQPRVSGYHRETTPRMQKQIREFYEDVALFAFPRREPVIADIDEKALFIRNPFTSMPGVRPRLPSPASYPAAPKEQVIDLESIVDLTGRLQADGRLVWDVPPGEWTIVRLGVRSTGANTRPAPAAGLGLESDKFSKEALATHFQSYFDPLLTAIGPRPIGRKVGFVALDADSWEMSSQNWTPGFREKFKRRRGYDPWLYFATYTGCVVDSREQSERFLWDIRRTCQELLLENHAAEMKRLCHQRGLRLMIEPYDMNPAGDLDLGSYADFPAGEFWFDTLQSGWSCIEAASVAHIMGKPIVLAEGFTSIGNWARSPWTLKSQTDWAFAVGINKFSIHGYAHQANEDAPGNTFGRYGVFWNRKQTFWPMVGAYHEYLARCSYLLQQGVTVSDILYLTPEGAPQVFQPPPSALHDAAGRLPDKKGYAFDGCSPRILMDRAEVRDGLISFPGGTSYRLLVLPRWKTMTPSLLEKIIQLVQSGAVVLGAPPISSPSLSNYPHCDAQVKQLAEQLWGKAPYVRERVLGKGRVFLDSAAAQLLQTAHTEDAPLIPRTGKRITPVAGDLYPGYNETAAVLRQLGVHEDFSATGPVRYAHRRTVAFDIYFVSNRTDQRIQADCTFRVAAGRPELWTPVNGERRPLPQYQGINGLTAVSLQFEPREGFFIVFPRGESFGSRKSIAGATNFLKATTVATLEGSWEVSFNPKWGGREKVAFDKLEDWTKRPEQEIKYYSGIATYRKSFHRPAGPPADSTIYLDLGTVHEMARVRLNGKDLGMVWCAPWRVDITRALEAGANRVEIEVANLWPNRLIGDAALPSERRLTKASATIYQKDSPLLPSGLLGPVVLCVEDNPAPNTDNP
jgi:hypothetical protein